MLPAPLYSGNVQKVMGIITRDRSEDQEDETGRTHPGHKS
jgi:hypothetical protein